MHFAFTSSILSIAQHALSLVVYHLLILGLLIVSLFFAFMWTDPGPDDLSFFSFLQGINTNRTYRVDISLYLVGSLVHTVSLFLTLITQLFYLV